MAGRIDLNAFTVFNAVMAEQSITRAASVLAMTQPAVSYTLSRLRVRMNDPLFYKAGRGIKPTAKALELWAQIAPALQAIELAVKPPAFDAASASRRFRVAASDMMVQLLWAPLRRSFAANAPGIDLLTFPYRAPDAQQMLANNEIDLCLGALPPLPEQIRTTFLYRSDFVCAMAKNNPLARSRLTLQRFAQAHHLLVSLSGDPYGQVDKVLAALGTRRRVAMTVNSFAAVPDLLRATDLIGIIASDLVRTPAGRSGLVVVRPPVEVPAVVIDMAWHARHERDPGHSWLRQQFLAAAQALQARPEVQSDAERRPVR